MSQRNNRLQVQIKLHRGRQPNVGALHLQASKHGCRRRGGVGKALSVAIKRSACVNLSRQRGNFASRPESHCGVAWRLNEPAAACGADGRSSHPCSLSGQAMHKLRHHPKGRSRAANRPSPSPSRCPSALRGDAAPLSLRQAQAARCFAAINDSASA